MYIVKLNPSKISKPIYKNLVEMDKWCNENCKGSWKHPYADPNPWNNYYEVPEYSVFSFELSDDALAFKLRWM